MPYNAAMAAGKIILGILTGSVFLAINSLYNAGMGLIRVFAIKTDRETGAGGMPPKEIKKRKYDFYMIAGGILMVCSAVYMIFSIRLFIGYTTMKYSMVAGIAIAAITFTEIGVAVRGIAVTRFDRRPVIEAIKLVNLACALISLVLTQTALLSFAYEGDASFYNGISGMIFGAVAALIGLYMVARGAWVQKGHYEPFLKKRVARYIKKLSKKQDFELSYADDSDETKMDIRFKHNVQKYIFEDIREKAYKKFGISLRMV